MVAEIVSGLEYSKKVLQDVGEKIAKTREHHPHFDAVLAIVQVGNRSDSNVYINAKLKKAKEIGANGKLIKLPDTITQGDLKREIMALNHDNNIDGIIVQLPLDCKHEIDADAIIDLIDPLKDVDGLTRINAGRLARGELQRTIFPCTPFGCLYLVQQATGNPNFVSGKEVVVLGRSKIVGSPAAALFLWHHGTVTICHSKTPNIKEKCLRADILIVAIGRKHYVKGEKYCQLKIEKMCGISKKRMLIDTDWIKPGAFVIDCGINVGDDPTSRKIYGDVDTEAAKEVAGYLTPVPGGVGPMTVAMLIRNTYEQARRRRLAGKDEDEQ
ncbi:CBN-DAO-3 protein [Caenorhabditis brenneri]|uniref:CBN-DAO-3 protein n=1 Tax=Caenorhabditis brenneri TaxID=135651 RepID=G0MW70_CAEBE|nr:CBN-DAO-3 protein [Caenorhabditis brenneri]